jgi:hypothetical protein
LADALAYYPSIPIPVIGMLNDATAGIGLVHTLYCDLRFAADNKVFTTTFARRGLIAERGISRMLPRIVGRANAPECDLLIQPVFALRATPGATRSPKGKAWWSQAGSNRRPRHCERRALPAELWPRRGRFSVTDAADNRRHLPSAPRSSQEQ